MEPRVTREDKMEVRSVSLCALVCGPLLAGSPAVVFAQTTGLTTVAEVAPVADPCPRAEAGALIQQPPALFSYRGALNVRFSYQTSDRRSRQDVVLPHDA